MNLRLRYSLYLHKRLESCERLRKEIKKRLNRSLNQLDEGDTILFGYQTGHLEKEDYDKWIKSVKK